MSEQSLKLTESKKSMLTVQEYIRKTKFNIDTFIINRFWTNMNDDIDIYIDEKIIRWMGYTGEYRNIKKSFMSLLRNFKINDDYQILNNQQYEKILCGPGVAQDLYYSKLDLSHGKGKTTHILLKPDTFREIMMMLKTKKASDIRKYYLSLEKLIKLYGAYQNDYKKKESNQLLIQSKETIEDKEKQLIQAQLEINEQKKELELRTIHKAIFDKAMKITNKDQEVYIITKKAYTADFKFKIGISTTSSHKRLTSLNTGNIKEDEAYICHIEKCYDAALVEKVIHKQLHKFNHDKEWFQFPYDLVQKLVIYACNNLNDYNEYYNDIMDEYNQQLLNNTIKIITPKPLAPNYKCRIVLENGPDKIILKDLRTLNEDEKNKYITEILQQYGINIDDAKDDDANRKLVKWADYKISLKNKLVTDNYKVTSKTFKFRAWKTALKRLYGKYFILLG